MSLLTAVLLVAVIVAIVTILVRELMVSDERWDARRRNQAHPWKEKNR